jgi:hypothetical protein
MNIIMNLKRKFKINGKESYSVEEMHHDIQEAREAFKKLMDSPVGSGHRINSAMPPNKIIFNGTEYENIDAMPQEVRRRYEKVLKAAKSGAPSSGVGIAGISGGMPGKPGANSTARPGEIRKPTKGEFSFSPWKLIVVAVLMALIFLIYYLVQNG